MERGRGWMPALVAAFVGGLGDSAAGQSPPPLVTDRPDQTESTAIVPPGWLQLELGWTVSQAEEGEGTATTHTLPEALARLGVLPRLELRIGLPVWSSVERSAALESGDSGNRGVGDASLGWKLRLAEPRGKRPAVAVLTAVTLPTGEDGFSSERVDPSFRFSFSHDLSERVAFGYNLGAEWASEEIVPEEGGGRERNADLLYTASVGYGLAERVGLYGEAFGFLGLEEGRADRHGWNGGLTFLARPNLQLDVRAGVGLSDAADEWFAGLGLSFRLPR